MLWIGAVAAIALLIIVHEAGHFLVARLCKMRVDRFSLGFGPGLLKWKRGDTTYQIAPLFFGGYVQIRGMNPAEDIDERDPHAYPNRPAWQRFATIFAGPGTNYLFAVVLAFAFYLAIGVPGATSRHMVAGVQEGFDAHGKLLEGDRIVAVEGEDVFLRKDGEAHTDLPKLVQEHAKEPMQVTVLRGGERVTVTITPTLDEPMSDKRGEDVYRLGIGLTQERTDIGPVAAAGEALVYPVRQTEVILTDLWRIATREVDPVVKGPVGITQIIKDQFEAGWLYVVQLLMLLNVYLGLINLLPLPALDGGRLAFLGYEMTTRRRPNPRVEAMVHMVGIMALLILMVLVTYNDVVNF